MTCWMISNWVKTSVLLALLYTCKARWNFSKISSIPQFLISSINLELKIQMSKDISLRLTTLKTLFSINLQTFSYLNAMYWAGSVTDVSARKDEWSILNITSNSLFLCYPLFLYFGYKRSFFLLFSNCCSFHECQFPCLYYS